MAVHSRPTLLLTRTRAASERFAQGLEGVDVVIAPLMEIVGIGDAVTLDGVSGLILTSENAVPFLPQARLPAFCVGPRTAEAANAAGFVAEVLGPDADGLVAAFSAHAPEGPLLHVHGVHTRGDVAGRLRKAGHDVREQAVYAQNDLPPGPEFHKAMGCSELIVPLFSPRSAKRFAKAMGHSPDQMTLFAMSPAVKQALPDALHARTHVLAHPTGAEMHEAVKRCGMRRNSP
ncbi:uroporphyrinogen-III synthase [Gymnodinialimonas ulvae]|uniref:uroporphyrinogen-III synthase n=1 Tax=Gymnodinialimonas ulvae TaxID=3126504 RepID=UPI00309665C3